MLVQGLFQREEGTGRLWLHRGAHAGGVAARSVARGAVTQSRRSVRTSVGPSSLAGGAPESRQPPAGPEPSGQQEPGAGSSSAGRSRGQVCRRGAVMVPASLESLASAPGEQRARAAAGGAPAAPFLYGFTSEGNAALKEPDGFRCVYMSVLN